MRILYLTEESIDVTRPMVRGGAIHVSRVVPALRKRGHEVSLLDWNSEGKGEKRTSVHPRTRIVDGAIRTYRQGLTLARELDVDVVLSKTRKTYLPGLAVARHIGVPHAVHVGTSLDPPQESSLPQRLDSLSHELRLRAPHDGYLVVCDYIRTQLLDRGVPDGRINEVGNAVDTEAFDPKVPESVLPDLSDTVDRDSLTVGFVGGLHKYKGVHDLIDAIEIADTDVYVVFAGDGPERPALRNRLAEGSGTLLGAVPYEAMPALYATLDVFALPSRTEGLPRVILEAQAMRSPVVATKVGGVPEVVTDGETGLLCPPRDPQSLAEAIDRLAEDEELREALSMNSRRHVVAGFSWESLYDRYESALESITQR